MAGTRRGSGSTGGGVRVGDMVRNSLGFVGIIVGINPLDKRFMVFWNNLAFAYPEVPCELELISAA